MCKTLLRFSSTFCHLCRTETSPFAPWEKKLAWRSLKSHLRLLTIVFVFFYVQLLMPIVFIKTNSSRLTSEEIEKTHSNNSLLLPCFAYFRKIIIGRLDKKNNYRNHWFQFPKRKGRRPCFMNLTIRILLFTTQNNQYRILLNWTLLNKYLALLCAEIQQG